MVLRQGSVLAVIGIVLGIFGSVGAGPRFECYIWRVRHGPGTSSDYLSADAADAPLGRASRDVCTPPGELL
jgi:hypothetical protein